MSHPCFSDDVWDTCGFSSDSLRGSGLFCPSGYLPFFVLVVLGVLSVFLGFRTVLGFMGFPGVSGTCG